jgi:hypothetical protein
MQVKLETPYVSPIGAVTASGVLAAKLGALGRKVEGRCAARPVANKPNPAEASAADLEEWYTCQSPLRYYAALNNRLCGSHMAKAVTDYMDHEEALRRIDGLEGVLREDLPFVFRAFHYCMRKARSWFPHGWIAWVRSSFLDFASGFEFVGKDATEAHGQPGPRYSHSYVGRDS